MLDILKKHIYRPTPPHYAVAPFSFFRDALIAKHIHEKGYYIADFLGEDERKHLRDTYERYYQINDEGPGAFYGEISKLIHNANSGILKDVLDKWFVDYKNMVSAFVVKTPGESGRVPIHQDSASVDETMFSNINIWIPLQSVNDVNGALHVLPRSHHIFVPYRAATIEPLTINIEQDLMPYFIPLYMEAGQALIFDSRMFHFSPPNLSGVKRVIAICKICPKEAGVIAYFKDKEGQSGEIEKWQCPDDHLQYGDNHNDSIRPRNSKLMKKLKVDIKPLTKQEFEKRRLELGIYSGAEAHSSLGDHLAS